jgi:hypothetical protein
LKCGGVAQTATRWGRDEPGMINRKSAANSPAQRTNARRPKKHHFPASQKTLKKGDFVEPHQIEKNIS